jgi:mono/diheme cytochrome c family protein
MSRGKIGGIAALACLSLLAMSVPGTQAVQTRGVGPAPSAASGVLNQYCLSCHNQGTRTPATASGAFFDRLDSSKVSEAPEIWEKVVRKLRTGTMPPPGSPRPAPEIYDATASWLEAELDRTARPDPGRPALRRLNRAEYGNAIRDLLDLHVDVESLLLPDDAAFGFDNIGDLLDVSPSLLERYLTAADRVSALAVGDTATPAGSQTYSARGDQSQNIDRQGMPLGTVGGLTANYTFPLSGEYEFRVALLRNNLEGIRGLEHPHQLEISVDGERLLLETVGGEADAARPGATITDKSDVTDARLRVRAPIQAGPRDVTATFVRKIGESTARLRPFDRSNADTYESIGRPHVETLTVLGPFLPSGAGDTPSRRRIFICRPDERNPSRDEDVCARRILSTLAQRAYRRPVTAADLELLLPFYKEGRQKGTFESGIQLALRRLLASPTFVFRAESDPQNGNTARISDIELASRLSFFLWSSIPDDTLLDLAARNRLREPAILEAQVRRMLADSRADAMAENFAGQWLHLRNLEGINPNTDEFPDFDNDLRLAFTQEAELFFSSIMREDRSVMDFLTADYTFVNERLARHYGIPRVYGSRFRRVALGPEFEARRGLLGKGGVLMSTSRADRTSPVLRGKWILENLLGTAPPPPPPNVPPLDAKPGAKPRTIRERMSMHRAPGCVSCHQLIDPLGFALEGFDAVGGWRTHEAGVPIDASSNLADGRAVNGVGELRAALAARPEAFVQTLTEKLMTYALGRGLQHYDMPVIRGIVKDSKAKNYSFTAVVLGIVKSVPFQQRGDVQNGRR